MTETHEHSAVLYETSSDLQRAVLDLVAQADGDDPLVLACRPHHNELLARALADTGPGRSAPVLLPRAEIHTRPVAVLAGRLRLARGYAPGSGGRIWLVTEPDYGTTPPAWTRAGQYEAACTLARTPMRLICAYHRPTTPDQMIVTIARTHPRLHTGDGPENDSVGNPAFQPPASVLAELGRPGNRSAPDLPPVLHVSGSVKLRDINGIRAGITEALHSLPTLVRTDFVAAVNEVLTNAHQHGGQPVDVTVWITEGEVECRVIDHGPGFDDPTTGYLPAPPSGRGGSGLWLARQACDTLQTWHSADGFTVRLATDTTPRQALRTEGAVARAETAHRRAAARRPGQHPGTFR